jgi:hypothetical protein
MKVRTSDPAQTAKRPVLIVVPNWPDGTMAFKFGSAVMLALGLQKSERTLVQLKPERIFRVETDVSEDQFRERLASRDVSFRGPVYFFEISG